MFKDQGKRGENAELQEELASNDKDKKRDAVKKVIRDMTLGKDVSGLFSAVVNNMMTPNLEVRKLVYLYLINYAKTQPELAIMAVNGFVKDASDPNPLIRALAVRTMGCIRVQSISEYLCESLRRALKDKDPYVRKTAAICVVKLHEISPDLVADQGFIESLEFLLDDANPTVVTNAVAALQEIGSRTNSKVLKLTPASVSKLLTVLNEASEWGQIYILDALATYLPSKVEEAEMMVDRVKPRLQHANSAVVLSSVKVMVKCLDQLDDNAKIASICKALGPPLVTLMSGEAENQFVALRNIQLICQKRPSVLLGEVKVFFCRYNDPIYVKMEKLDVLVMLTSEHTVDQTLAEFKEYATEIDHEFVCKAVRCIGRTAIKLEAATERCVKVLVYLIETKVNYLVQEAIIVIRDIFRKYPNKYEDIITTLCANLDTLDNAEAKAAMVWIIGEYADRIDNAAELLESFLEGFADEQHAVQLQLLTATVKLFLKRPQVAQDMVKQVLAQVTQHTDSPDLRDRGYMYWRLLSCDPEAAKAIVCGPKPTIEDDTKAIDRSLLDELVDNLSNLASVYHKRPSAFVDRKKAVLETDDYDEAEETDQADPDQPAGAETRAHPPVTDLLSLDEPTKPQGDNGTVGMDASQDALQDMLGGPRTSHIGPSAPRSQAQAGEGDLLSDLLGSSSVPSGVQELALLLSPDRAAGLRLRGGMAEQAGQAVYELHLSNTAATAIGTFNMMLNKNVYGLQVMCVDVPAVPAGGEQRVTLRMSSDASRIQVAPPAPTAGGSIAQVAIKTNAGVFYYTDTIPLAAVTVAHEVAQNDWLSQWSQMAVPSSQAAVIHLKGFAMHDADAVEAALKDRRFHIVARRPGNAGATAFYMSCRTVAQQTILWELQVLPTAARVTAKATTPGLASIVGAALEPLLQAALPIAGATHNASATMPSQPPFSSSVVGLGGGVMGAAASVPAAGAPAVDLLEGLF